MHVGPRIDVRSRELVQIALRDTTNAMAVARTSENAAQIQKNVIMCFATSGSCNVSSATL